MGIRRRTLALASAVLAASVAFGAPQAQAGFFDRLFGGPVRTRTADFPPPPRAVKRAPARAAAVARAPVRAPASGTPAPRIESPTYYAYKAAALTRVDFTKLASTAQSASLDEEAAPTPFRSAVADLQGYELLAEAATAKALVEYYSANPDFLWVQDGRPTDRAKAAVATLADAGSYGLDPDDYAVALPQANGDAATARSEAIRFEMALSTRVLRYLSDATNGRVEANRMSGYYDMPAKPFDQAAALKSLAGATDIRPALEAAHPQNPQYAALRAELKTLRASTEREIVVDPQLRLKPGESSPEFAKLIALIAGGLDDDTGAEFGEVLARYAGSEVYAPELVPVIKAAQKRAGQKADGVIGPRTMAIFAVDSTADRVAKVLVALEQMRWMPSTLGPRRVFINAPAFTASYFDNDQELLNMRAVIGKTTNQTSFFYDEIEQVDFNPYWGVPQSIIVNEMLPRLRSDPGYLDRAGYEVTDAKGRRIPSSSVNWGAYGAKLPFNVRQIPSEANALGQLKILFPNKFAIYMHDTPEKTFFKRDMRALSHGCIRLEQPRAMAAAVLGTSVEYVADKIARGHSSQKAPVKIPVYVGYFTAWPNAAGKVEYFADVYGRDSRLRQALESTEAVRAPSS